MCQYKQIRIYGKRNIDNYKILDYVYTGIFKIHTVKIHNFEDIKVKKYIVYTLDLIIDILNEKWIMLRQLI